MADLGVQRYAHRAAWSGLVFGLLLAFLTGFSVAASLTYSATWWIGAWALAGVRRDLLTSGQDDRGR